MGDQTGIEWTDHAFNPWWGCTRISPACEHCYAETFAARFGVRWGVKADRRPSSEKVWSGPLRWDAAAAKAGRRARVFCASMADVFEERAELDPLRARLWALIGQTPHLDWQLLTKRIDCVRAMVPAHWMTGGWPSNVWIGTTVEDQARADSRIPHLLGLPARVRFLSCEPLLGPVRLSSQWIGEQCFVGGRCGRDGCDDCDPCVHYAFRRLVDWVIVGGESGPGARPMHPDWARSLRNQCARAAVPFFFKQWGEWAPANAGPSGDIDVSAFDIGAMKASGFFTYNDDWHECAGLTGLNSFRRSMVRVGKKAAGSLLDGVEHKAFPRTARPS